MITIKKNDAGKWIKEDAIGISRINYPIDATALIDILISKGILKEDDLK